MPRPFPEWSRLVPTARGQAGQDFVFGAGHGAAGERRCPGATSGLPARGGRHHERGRAVSRHPHTGEDPGPPDGSSYLRLSPARTGSLGLACDYDHRRHRALVGPLSFEFDTPAHDDLGGTHGYQIVTAALARALEESDLTGFELGEVIALTEDRFEGPEADTVLAEDWKHLIASETYADGADFVRPSRNVLMVRQAAFELLEGSGTRGSWFMTTRAGRLRMPGVTPSPSESLEPGLGVWTIVGGQMVQFHGLDGAGTRHQSHHD